MTAEIVGFILTTGYGHFTNSSLVPSLRTSCSADWGGFLMSSAFSGKSRATRRSASTPRLIASNCASFSFRTSRTPRMTHSIGSGKCDVRDFMASNAPKDTRHRKPVSPYPQPRAGLTLTKSWPLSYPPTCTRDHRSGPYLAPTESRNHPPNWWLPQVARH